MNLQRRKENSEYNREKRISRYTAAKSDYPTEASIFTPIEANPVIKQNVHCCKNPNFQPKQWKHDEPEYQELTVLPPIEVNLTTVDMYPVISEVKRSTLSYFGVCPHLPSYHLGA